MRNNIFTYLFLIPICFAFAFAFTGLLNIANFLGWVFSILTAGMFFFSGKNFVDQGAFYSNGWKVVFVVLSPLILYIDYLLNQKISWYDNFAGFAYYALFTLGFLLKKNTK
jgi:hypothetical protein